MTLAPATLERLRFLARVVDKEGRHLAITSERLFRVPFTADRVVEMEVSVELAERVEAFVSRFGRLQDTLGDKLLPAVLNALGERTAALIDNLDRAERLGLVPSTDQWLQMRRLRNQMVHEYVEDPRLLADALELAHGYVPVLMEVAGWLGQEMNRRGWV